MSTLLEAKAKDAQKRTPHIPPIETCGMTSADGTITEIVFRPNLTPAYAFAVKTPDGKIEYSPARCVGGTNYSPAMLSRKAIALPEAAAGYGTPLDLLESLVGHLRSYLALSLFEISLLAHYVLMTWVYDAWIAFPYLRFKGEAATGKTRCLEVLKELCFRATDMGVSPTQSALFRRANQTRGTLIIDEADYEGDLHSALIQVMNAGYRRDGTVTRSVAHKEDWEPETFSVGGPKILANRRDFKDRALETRCLTVYTTSRDAKDVPTELPPDFGEKSLHLRNQLLQYRFDTFRSQNKEETAVSGLEGRARQLGLPLYNISPDPRFQEQLLNHLRERSTILQDCDPVSILLEVLRDFPGLAKYQSLPYKNLQEEAEKIAVARDIDKGEFSGRRIGDLVRSIGLKTSRQKGGYVVHINPDLIKKEAIRLNLTRND